MNPEEIDKLVKNGLERIKNIQGFEKIKFIILYGSGAEGRTIENSDIDICIDFDAKTDYERSRPRLNVLSGLPDFFGAIV